MAKTNGSLPSPRAAIVAIGMAHVPLFIKGLKEKGVSGIVILPKLLAWNEYLKVTTQQEEIRKAREGTSAP